MSEETSYTLKPRNAGEAIKVAEAVLERRDRNIKALSERANKIKQLRKDRKEVVKPKRLLSANKLVKKNVTKRKEKKRMLITAKQGKNRRLAQIPSDAKVLLVVRNDKKALNNSILKTLSKLRLSVANNARFILPTPENLELMRIAEPFLYFGVATQVSVSDLLTKKAYIKKGDKAVPLNDNAYIEEVLGMHDVFCVEDIVEVISNGVKNTQAFDAIAELLTPFHLNDYRKVHGNLKTSRPVQGLIKKLDDVVMSVV